MPTVSFHSLAHSAPQRLAQPASTAPSTSFLWVSISSGFTGRNIELEQLSLNNVSRVEVIFSQTPESPGGAIGGSVNLVPRSAFERSKPSTNASLFYMFRDNDRHFRASPGPQSHSTPKVTPGAEFNYSSGALTK